MTVSGVILSHERRHNGVGINYSHYRDVICDCPAPSSSYSARGPFASKYLTKIYFRNTECSRRCCARCAPIKYLACVDTFVVSRATERSQLIDAGAPPSAPARSLDRSRVVVAVAVETTRVAVVVAVASRASPPRFLATSDLTAARASALSSLSRRKNRIRSNNQWSPSALSPPARCSPRARPRASPPRRRPARSSAAPRRARLRSVRPRARPPGVVRKSIKD